MQQLGIKCVVRKIVISPTKLVVVIEAFKLKDG